MVTVCKKNIKIFYHPELDGGGKDIAVTDNHYIDFIKNNIGKVDTIFEWCCGPAFIGFRLLEENLCNNLVLADVNNNALEMCRKTVQENKLDNVKIYHSDNFKNIPIQKFDLIVGNPPFYSKKRTLLNWNEVLYVDDNWHIHENFYNNVSKYLTKNSDLLILEHPNQSDPTDFEDMIDSNNLKIKQVKLIPTVWDHDLYVIWITPNE